MGVLQLHQTATEADLGFLLQHLSLRGDHWMQDSAGPYYFRTVESGVFAPIYTGFGSAAGDFTYGAAGPESGTLSSFQRYVIDYNAPSARDVAIEGEGFAADVAALRKAVGGDTTADAVALLLAGDDTVLGSTGNDQLGGHAGADSVAGGEGADSLAGGEGADTLAGGAGKDALSGGAGADRFVFGPGDKGDRITDFSVAEHDVLDLSALTPGGASDPAAWVQVVGHKADARVLVDAHDGHGFVAVVTLKGLAGLDLPTLLAGQDLLLG